MTKDLAVSIYGNNVPDGSYLYTEDFLDVVAKNLDAKLVKA
jgi:hypothetical protein